MCKSVKRIISPHSPAGVNRAVPKQRELMDDDAFNIECQYEPTPGGWRAGDSMEGDDRKIRVHLWHDTVGY